MVEMFRDTGVVTKKIGGRDRLAGGAFALAAAAAYGAAVLSTGGLVALAKSAAKGATWGAGIDAGIQTVRIYADPRESWSWTELVESAGAGALLGPIEHVGGAVFRVGKGALRGAGRPAGETVKGASRVITEAFETKASDVLWKQQGLGVRIRRLGNYWIKELDPNASAIARWWGRMTMKAQAEGLEKLGETGTSFLYREGKIITRHVGEFGHGYASPQFLRAFLQGSRRLRTPFNDIRVRNLGAGGRVFDPALDPVSQTVLRFSVAYLGGVLGRSVWNRATGE